MCKSTVIKKPYTILYAEDIESIRKSITSGLGVLFEKVYSVKDGDEALKVINEHPIDILITDLSMPNLNGIDLIKEVRSRYKTLPIIITTGYPEFSDIYDNVFNIETLTKPYSIFDIIRIIDTMQYRNGIIKDAENAYKKLEEGYAEARKLLNLINKEN